MRRNEANLAGVAVSWRVYRADDTLLWGFRNTYKLANYGDLDSAFAWKVLVSTTHA